MSGPLAGSALCALALGACRADSVTTPEAHSDPVCYTGSCTEPLPPALGEAIVIEPLEDVATRIVPTITNARARTEAVALLDGLRRELRAGRPEAARMQLAHTYDWIERAGALLNVAELTAVRLALVPAASALGVRAP